MSDFSIRRARPEDADLLADFNVEMALETEDYRLDRATVREGVRGPLETEGNGFYLVAVDGGGAVIGGLLVTYEWTDWRNGVLWWIQSVYIVPAWRGRGVYRALYAEVKAQAQATGNVRGLRLYVERDNTNAQAAYQKLGMQETHYRIYEEIFD
jgi:ribosomal protein S18 acetylase RimI-like enzyme